MSKSDDAGNTGVPDLAAEDLMGRSGNGSRLSDFNFKCADFEKYVYKKVKSKKFLLEFVALLASTLVNRIGGKIKKYFKGENR